MCCKGSDKLEDKLECASYMVYGECMGCYNGGYTTNDYYNDYDFNDPDFIG